jgi:hypothetical protein
MIKGMDRAFKAFDKMISNTNNSVKINYIKALNDIIRQTPVHFKDGGRLRNSWTLSEGSPSGVERAASGSGAGSLASVNRMPESVLGKKLFFTNPMPYANVVEYGGYPNPVKQGTNISDGDTPQYQKLSRGGYSLQAPSGMVRLNKKRLQTRLKRLRAR